MRVRISPMSLSFDRKVICMTGVYITALVFAVEHCNWFQADHFEYIIHPLLSHAKSVLFIWATLPIDHQATFETKEFSIKASEILLLSRIEENKHMQLKCFLKYLTLEKRWFSILWAIVIFRYSGRTFSRTFLCCRKIQGRTRTWVHSCKYPSKILRLKMHCDDLVATCKQEPTSAFAFGHGIHISFP